MTRTFIALAVIAGLASTSAVASPDTQTQQHGESSEHLPLTRADTHDHDGTIRPAGQSSPSTNKTEQHS